MITITYEGKTYQPKWQFYHVESILDWIAWGDLEEVKEKTEEKRFISDYEYYKKDWEILKDTSILEKIREELKRRITKYEMDDMPAYEEEAQEILAFLTSLETKEEPAVFKTGDMIEVSNDGKKWKEATFMNMSWPERDSFCCTLGFTIPSYYNFARALTSSNELPELPYFKAYPNGIPDGITLRDRYAEQLEALTTYIKSRENIK